MKFRRTVWLQITLLLLMLCLPAVAGANSTEISLVLSTSTAAIGESVTASGTTNPNAWVPLKIVDEEESILVFDTWKADASGNYSIDFIVPDTNSETLTIVVGEGSNVAVETLIVGTEQPVVFTVTGDGVTAGEKTYTLNQLKALGETTDSYSYFSSGQTVTQSCTGVLLGTVLADAGVTDPDWEITVLTTDGYTHETYTVTLQESIDNAYLVTYLVNGEPFEDMGGETSSTIRIYRNHDDGSSWLNRLKLVSGVEVTSAQPPVLPGDVDGDGSVDIDDAQLIALYDAQLTTLTEQQLAAADVSGDELVDIDDALLIAQYDAQLISDFPVNQ